MKIAYFIMAHHKPDMLLRMMNAIYTEDNIYLIHIDLGGSDELQELALNLANSNSNIRLLPSRFLMWGGWSLVQVELDAMNYLLQLNNEWSYYINLSGQDFPLLSQGKIQAFFNGQDTNFIQVKQRNEDETRKRAKLQENYYIEDAGEVKMLGDRKAFEAYFSPGIKQFGGSQWKMVTREFAAYATSSRLSFEMQEYFRYTFIPDEQFFQTLIMNSPFASKVARKNLRCLRMESDAQKVFYHAATFTMSDIHALFDSEGLFARKFDHDVDADVIEFIENLISISS